jgi:hypothetical protein
VYLSVFQTREVRQPTSEFVVACPCPDGLMQDGTQEGNEAYIILHRGARSRGYKRREGARARARERGLVVNMSVYVNVNLHLSVSPRAPAPTSTSTSLKKALDIPFYRCKEMSSCTTGCSYALQGWRGSALSPIHELTWPSEKCLEPYRSTAVGRHGSC